MRIDKKEKATLKTVSWYPSTIEAVQKKMKSLGESNFSRFTEKLIMRMMSK